VNAIADTDGPATPADRVRAMLDRVLEACGLEGAVQVAEDEETIRAEVDGENLGLLIGRHGQTIDALQHLAFRVAFPATDAQRKRVVVDAAGYRERRAEVLQRQADRAANEALESGRPVPLDAMAASERRLVHEYLRDRHDIETYSEGEEPQRRLVIAPVVA
jgi:spoIIIJ-associated protein